MRTRNLFLLIAGLTLVLTASLAAAIPPMDEPPPEVDGSYCGDGICNPYESSSTCPADCSDPAPPPPSTGDGHIWCDGWDKQPGQCALSYEGVAAGAEFRRLRGGGGYVGQTFLTWNPAEFGGFDRFTVSDGDVGNISTSPLPGQIPLYRWSTRKGFAYSTVYTEHTNDYVYYGIAGYVWPAGTNKGYPLYQFYSQEYGHFYTNYPNDIRCQPNVYWDFQGEMARVNWPAPFLQANRVCYNNGLIGPIPPNCNPFIAIGDCIAMGRFFDFNSCQCL